MLINFQVLNAFSIFSLENVGDDISELLAESVIAMVQIRVIRARLTFSTAHASRNKREKKNFLRPWSYTKDMKERNHWRRRNNVKIWLLLKTQIEEEEN